MNTNIKKKGKSAIAIVLSLAMILTTATFPVSIAKADTPQVMPVVVALTDSQPTGGDGPQHYNLPTGYNFVYIKQGDDSHVLWTAENYEWIWGKTIDVGETIGNTKEKDGPEWASFKKFLGSQLNFASDLKKETSIDYIYGFENSPFVFNEDQPGEYSYEFTMDEADGHISFLYNGKKVSHFYAGRYKDSEESKYKIEVTKAITLNGESTNPLEERSFFVALFDAAGKMIGDKQEIKLDDNEVSGKATFTVTDPDIMYYVYEVDSSGNKLVPGIDIEGYYLKSITNQGSTIKVSSTTVPATLIITNNFVDRESDTIPVSINKKLVGMDLTEGQFSFTLVRTNKEWEPLKKATPDIQTNDSDGVVNFEDLTFAKKGTYYYMIFENIPETTDSDFINGMDYDSHIIYLTIKVKEEDDKLVATVKSKTGSSTFTNTMQYGQISVTKEVEWTEDSVNPVPITKTFRAGLFTLVNDEYELVQIAGEDAIVELNVENSADATATFDDLPLDQTYYVFEIDENDEPLVTDPDGNFPDATYGWVALKYTTNPIELTEEDASGEITITNYFKDFGGPLEAGEITVTKEITVLSGNTKITHVFHVALFEDQDGVMVKVTGVKDLPIVDSVSTSVTFEELDLDKTYYVFETDDAGNIIQTNNGKIVTPILKGWTKIEYTNPKIPLDVENQVGRATINNTFEKTDFDPSVKVIKTVTVNNKPTASNLTFYAGLFEDKELTKLVAFKPLPMNGGISAEASFAFYQDGVTPLKAGATYYVAETDSAGKPLAGTAKELGFGITINGVTNNNSTVVLIEQETVVNIVNNFKKEEFPLTGDNSNMNLWLFLAMLGVAGAIAPFAFRKKEVAND